MIGLKIRYAVFDIMSKVNPAVLKRLTIRSRRSEKFGFPMIVLNLYTKSPQNSGLQKPCCIRLFQTDMIFFDQFKEPTIKFGKCFWSYYTDIRSVSVKNLLRLLKSVTCEDALAKQMS